MRFVIGLLSGSDKMIDLRFDIFTPSYCAQKTTHTVLPFHSFSLSPPPLPPVFNIHSSVPAYCICLRPWAMEKMSACSVSRKKYGPGVWRRRREESVKCWHPLILSLSPIPPIPYPYPLSPSLSPSPFLCRDCPPPLGPL